MLIKKITDKSLLKEVIANLNIWKCIYHDTGSLVRCDATDTRTSRMDFYFYKTAFIIKPKTSVYVTYKLDKNLRLSSYAN